MQCTWGRKKDYSQKGETDQMKTTWEKILHHVGNIYGHEISSELKKKNEVLHPQA